MSEKKKIDLEKSASDKEGIAGFLENLFRKYKTLGFLVAMTFVLVAYICCLSLSFAPGFLLFSVTLEYIEGFNIFLRSFFLALALTASIGLFVFSLLTVIPVFNKFLTIKDKHWRGNWYSLNMIPWYYHNALVQLARYTVLPFLTSTPLLTAFYKAMGMKIGKGCVINSVNIQDPCLLELGDFVTIGGSATIFCHYAQGGYFIMGPVKIGKGATIGLKSSIMGDVEIGEKVLVPAHKVVFPKSRLSLNNIDQEEK